MTHWIQASSISWWLFRKHGIQNMEGCHIQNAERKLFRKFIIRKSTFWKWRRGLPWWSNGWESTCQCRGYRFGPWSRKIPHAPGQLSHALPLPHRRATATEACAPGACATREATGLRSLQTTLERCPACCN